MANMQALINRENRRKLYTPDNDNHQNDKKCNCRTKADCPLDNNCLVKNVIYQATVTTTTATNTYIGLTETEFKTRYRNHVTSFRQDRYRNATELSKYIWDLKDSDTEYNIKWAVVKRAQPYNSVTKFCNLCLTEKYFIVYKPWMCTLNQRKDLIIACRHKNKYLLSGVG